MKFEKGDIANTAKKGTGGGDAPRPPAFSPLGDFLRGWRFPAIVLPPARLSRFQARLRRLFFLQLPLTVLSRSLYHLVCPSSAISDERSSATPATRVYVLKLIKCKWEHDDDDDDDDDDQIYTDVSSAFLYVRMVTGRYELQICIGKIGEELSMEEAEIAAELIDSDGDGLLSFEDLVSVVESANEEEKSQEGRREEYNGPPVVVAGRSPGGRRLTGRKKVGRRTEESDFRRQTRNLMSEEGRVGDSLLAGRRRSSLKTLAGNRRERVGFGSGSDPKSDQIELNSVQTDQKSDNLLKISSGRLKIR
ncbi:hypothetical protein LXL04_000363 [Taraxacum kok-saghyz]